MFMFFSSPCSVWALHTASPVKSSEWSSWSINRFLFNCRTRLVQMSGLVEFYSDLKCMDIIDPVWPARLTSLSSLCDYKGKIRNLLGMLLSCSFFEVLGPLLRRALQTCWELIYKGSHSRLYHAGSLFQTLYNPNAWNRLTRMCRPVQRASVSC